MDIDDVTTLISASDLLKILEKIPVTSINRMSPHVVNTVLPPFKKQGVLVDVDEITDAKESNEKTQQNPKKNSNVNAKSQAYSCIQCHRTLPTAHLLDLHIAEQHDMYFAASVERGDKPMYACYIEECTVKFHEPTARKDHCIAVHKFPANYRFDQEKLKTVIAKKKLDDMMASIEINGVTSTLVMPNYIKAFSFGHHPQRSFYTGKERQPPGKTLEDVKAMKEALEEME